MSLAVRVIFNICETKFLIKLLDHRPSRTIYRGTDLQRAREYVATGNTAHIATAKPGDFHKHSSAQQAAYYTFNEAYADQCAQKNPGTGAVIQQRVPSSLLDSGYHFPTEPSSDWRTTVLHNRAQQSTPRDPRAVAQSRQRDATTGPIADVHTKGLLSATRKNPSGPAYADAFKPAIEPRSSTGASGIDEHRRGPEWAQQIRLQGPALQAVAGCARSARAAKAPERRR